MLAKIQVTLKKGVLDSQGKAVESALRDLGYKEVGSVAVGRYMELQLAETDRAAAEKRVQEMCDKLLANPIIETYRYTLEA